MAPTTPLHITPELHIHLTGDIHVHQEVTNVAGEGEPTGVEFDPATIIRDYLAQVDVNALETEALTGDPSQSVTASLIQVLHDHAVDYQLS